MQLLRVLGQLCEWVEAGNGHFFGARTLLVGVVDDTTTARDIATAAPLIIVTIAVNVTVVVAAVLVENLLADGFTAETQHLLEDAEEVACQDDVGHGQRQVFAALRLVVDEVENGL